MIGKLLFWLLSFILYFQDGSKAVLPEAVGFVIINTGSAEESFVFFDRDAEPTNVVLSKDIKVVGIYEKRIM